MPKAPKQSRSSKKARAKVIPYAKGFQQPSKARIANALGKTEAVEFKDDGTCFKPVPLCTSIDDWLAQYNEEGQTFYQFTTENPWMSSRRRKYMNQTFISNGKTLHEKYPDGKIYILPLGHFDGDTSPEFSALVEYAKHFFCFPIETLPPVQLELESKTSYWIDDRTYDKSGKRKVIKKRLSSRFHDESKQRQLKVDDILLNLRDYLPSDAICLIALTMSDLYETNPDLFVAGMAAGQHRVAVFSLLRYNPNLRFSQEFWFKLTPTKDFSHEVSGWQQLFKPIFLDGCYHKNPHML